eukprot:50456-Eustigmatos_ZCMA.PRE.1
MVSQALVWWGCARAEWKPETENACVSGARVTSWTLLLGSLIVPGRFTLSVAVPVAARWLLCYTYLCSPQYAGI